MNVLACLIFGVEKLARGADTSLLGALHLKAVLTQL